MNGPSNSAKDGGSDNIDGAVSGDAEIPPDANGGEPDGGGDAAADEDGGGDASMGPCRVNPDAENTACPEICLEVCNGKDDDCDGRTDESADRSCAASNAEAICQAGECFLSQCLAEHRDCDQMAATGCEIGPTDPNNCGGCGRVCNIVNASEICDDGSCVVDKCEGGYADCDSDRVSCETHTNTLVNCAGCGVACKNVPHAQASCEQGFCGVASCNGGFGDCDKKPENGCEQTLDTLAHCGGCNMPCSKASCGGGICTAADCTLTPGFADCDRDEASCETNLRADPNNCGACGFKCQFTAGVTPHASAGCAANGCVPMCDAGYGDCDGNFSNGCEQQLNTMTHCGACGQACAIGNANATCSTGSCSVQSCRPDFADCDADQKSCETALNAPNHCGSCGMVCNLPNTVEGCGGSAGARVCSVASCDANWADCDADASNGCERDVRAIAGGGLGPCLPDTGCTKASSAGRDYYFCPSARTWSDARSRCQLQLRGDLAHISDATEDNFIKARINTTNWVGHTDSSIEGLWIWSDNRVPFWRGVANGGALNGLYTNWASGEPNASGNCGVIYNTTGQFDDANCSSTLPFVCEVGPDGCPSDATKNDPGQCGCGVADTDTDNDGFADCKDGCPSDATKQAAGVCGCGTPDADNDGDGRLNCQDGCPNDPAKQAAGSCGCGVSDANSDGDSQLDCNETCDSDPNKLAPGVCGCGISDADSDGDGTPNCQDQCPADPTVTSACFPFTQSNFNTSAINYSTTPASTLNCGTTTVNTSTTPATISNWCGGAPTPIVQSQSGGPEVVILALKSLTIASGSTLRLTGSRPVILAVRGNVQIDGTIDANANGSTPGAGGEWSCGSSEGGNGGGSAAFAAGGGGGGGGGFGTAGGRGGQGNNSSNYGNGGGARGSTSVIPLYGGCGGGTGGGCSASSAAGGGGGGAIQISSSGTLTVTGTIRANGAAGANGCSTEGGGAGGGSGGAILLEAATKNIGGTVTVNGGAGGDGIGLLNASGANGSSSSGSSGGTGGNASGAGGGGGGGFGRIKK